ncbi:CLUMA_CG018681, isoform A [Clunio marinus]|uniref:CLUMA_CG018681, isoform A n=1 Tax=Clunio marinus TaxID=568069 RepID=A0A1J1J2H9_9DIPT|nr:CLUMA_CG018681, isoform A [Clunio marinus]
MLVQHVVTLTSVNLMETSIHFIKTMTKNGEHRINRGSLIVDGAEFQASYTILNLPFYAQILALNSNLYAHIFCYECGFFTKEGAGIYVYILSRLAFPECEDVNQLMDALDACGIPSDAFTKMDQSNCAKC